MFGTISAKELELIDDYFSQFIKFISCEKNELDLVKKGNRNV